MYIVSFQKVSISLPRMFFGLNTYSSDWDPSPIEISNNPSKLNQIATDTRLLFCQISTLNKFQLSRIAEGIAHSNEKIIYS